MIVCAASQAIIQPALKSKNSPPPHHLVSGLTEPLESLADQA
jgi:hypothetical protein